MTNKKILLIEPGYRNKYPPLGLMKLAAYHKQRKDIIKFVKGEDSSVFLEAWDRVYVTTLFSFEWKRTSKAIDFAIQAAGNQPERVFVGGVAASLMHEEFLNETRWIGVRFIAGLLDGPPAQALQLSTLDGDFGADDYQSEPIEERVPDYSILDGLDYRYPVNDAYFGYASRGCVRKCRFCGVPKLEGGMKEMPPLYKLVEGIAKNHGPKKDLVLMDNNITASIRFRDVIAEIRDLGFETGAKLNRNNSRVKRRVDFNQGVDARILAKSPMYLKEISTICISPLRIAFDNLGFRKVYDKSIRMAADNGITSLSNYMLYNFMDTPIDLYIRMKINIALNEELGIRIWSFPMRYQPVTLKDRSHIGKFWNSYYLRNFQIMLQATHGVVSGNAPYFYRAFGESVEEFLELLSYPTSMIFHRNYYEFGNGKEIRSEYESLRKRMSKLQKEEFLGYLTSSTGSEKMRRTHFQKLAETRRIDPLIRQILSIHTLFKRDELVSNDKIFPPSSALNPVNSLPAEEEFVEDAGLFDQNLDEQTDTSIAS